MEQITETRRDKLIRLFNILRSNWSRAQISPNAAQMAYFALLALVPTLLIVANVIPLLPIDTNQLLSTLESIIPGNIYDIVAPMLQGYLESGSGGAISIGAITLLWSASNLVNILRQVLNEVYGIKGLHENALLDRILSPIFMLLFILVIGAFIFAFIFGEQILSLLQQILGINLGIIEVFLTWRTPVLMIVLFILFLLVYRFIPNHDLSLKQGIPGALFSTVAWMILSEVFTFYTQASGNVALSNATIGTLVVLMLYLYFSGMVVLIGGLMNTMFFEWRHRQSVRQVMMDEKEQKILSENRNNFPDKPFEEPVLTRRVKKVTPESIKESPTDAGNEDE